MTQENTKKIEKKVKKLKNDKNNFKIGDTIEVTEIISKTKDGKLTTQKFEGIVIAKKHGREPGATFTVRKIIEGIGVEKTFPLHSPLIQDIKIKKRGRARKSKIYWIREKTEREIRKKLKPKKV
ncbi:MAG: 50S ribosomal protein L19 [Candidatus Pacebacteria bacterium]|nr:50S ribosomal protein L19 [Candidatus Paceibacterota bacterium]